MTSNKKLKTEDATEQILPVDMKSFLKDINREKYLYPCSNKVFDNVSSFYLLNKKSHNMISSISSKFLLSSFSLDYLNLLNNLTEMKHNIPQLTLKDFDDIKKIEDVKNEILKSQNEPYINWLTEECLTELIDAIDNLVIEDIESLNKLGHILKLTVNELQHEENPQDVELYDTLYRFIDRLDNFEVGQKKQDFSLKYSIIKKSKEGDSTDISIEIKCSTKKLSEMKHLLELY